MSIWVSLYVSCSSLHQVVYKLIGPQQLLEVADLCDSTRPDERSVMTYVAGFFHAFSTMGEYHLINIGVCNLFTILTC